MLMLGVPGTCCPPTAASGRQPHMQCKRISTPPLRPSVSSRGGHSTCAYLWPYVSTWRPMSSATTARLSRFISTLLTAAALARSSSASGTPLATACGRVGVGGMAAGVGGRWGGPQAQAEMACMCGGGGGGHCYAGREACAKAVQRCRGTQVLKQQYGRLPAHLHLLAQHIHHVGRLAALRRGKDAHLRSSRGREGEAVGHKKRASETAHRAWGQCCAGSHV